MSRHRHPPRRQRRIAAAAALRVLARPPPRSLLQPPLLSERLPRRPRIPIASPLRARRQRTCCRRSTPRICRFVTPRWPPRCRRCPRVRARLLNRALVKLRRRCQRPRQSRLRPRQRRRRRRRQSQLANCHLWMVVESTPQGGRDAALRELSNCAIATRSLTESPASPALPETQRTRAPKPRRPSAPHCNRNPSRRAM